MVSIIWLGVASLACGYFQMYTSHEDVIGKFQHFFQFVHLLDSPAKTRVEATYFANHADSRQTISCVHVLRSHLTNVSVLTITFVVSVLEDHSQVTIDQPACQDSRSGYVCFDAL